MKVGDISYLKIEAVFAVSSPSVQYLLIHLQITHVCL